jgi:hypothetical protein
MSVPVAWNADAGRYLLGPQRHVVGSSARIDLNENLPTTKDQPFPGARADRKSLRLRALSLRSILQHGLTHTETDNAQDQSRGENRSALVLEFAHNALPLLRKRCETWS